MSTAFDERGLLPAGCHEFKNWSTFAAVFAFNDHRYRQLERLKDFVRDELAMQARGLELVVGGSFVSDKERPSDIDCTVALPASLVGRRLGLMALVGDGDKGRIYTYYGVEFYLSLLSPGMNDFRSFFSYVGETTGIARGLDAKEIRGTVRVKQWAKP